MTQSEYLLILSGMAAATFLPRWVPLFFLARRRLAGWLTEWLDLIPAAILGALLAPALFPSEVSAGRIFSYPPFLAAIPTFLVAVRTRSLGGSVVTGMAAFWLLS